ncbi:hypothetical protein CEXT_14801 [Caerostris extrusa]|uniref:Uncharacterized protein n=1 Tax=Caerostris extrusa TaxID=172846 RepID=A0AAV4XNA9_CAEEX|nr:hypothetical protein CEXT_14801 [Caerostris extrusa]
MTRQIYKAGSSKIINPKAKLSCEAWLQQDLTRHANGMRPLNSSLSEMESDSRHKNRKTHKSESHHRWRDLGSLFWGMRH